MKLRAIGESSETSLQGLRNAVRVLILAEALVEDRDA